LNKGYRSRIQRKELWQNNLNKYTIWFTFRDTMQQNDISKEWLGLFEILSESQKRW
jgi:hypothetical protein